MLAQALVIALTLAPGNASGEAGGVLHPGDKVSISVFNHPELSLQSSTLDASGQVSVPLAGTVDGGGIGPASLAQRIATRLRRYVPLAAVDVRLLEQGQEIFLTGDRGGVLKYAPGETLVAALQDASPHAVTAGSAAPDLRHGPIDLHTVRITRNKHNLGPFDVASMIERGDAGPALAPGDTLRLQNKPIRVSVGGEVKQAGYVYLEQGEPLATSIAQAGGELPTSWTAHAELRRAGTSRTVALGDAAFGEPAQNGDAVYVPRAPHVEVLGSVVKPGNQILAGDATLLNALYDSGGPLKYGNLRSVAVLHQGQRKEYDVTRLAHGATDQNPTLADGDTVFVPEGHKVDFSAVFQALSGLYLFRHL